MNRIIGWTFVILSLLMLGASIGIVGVYFYMYESLSEDQLPFFAGWWLGWLPPLFLAVSGFILLRPKG